MTPAVPTPLRLPQKEVKDTLFSILRQHGFIVDQARTLAATFTNNSLDGVHTHGLNRFPRFVEMVQQGHVKVNAHTKCKNAQGGIEQWDGQLGPGILNALEATDRAMALAREFGLGCVGLANTNHWMRGGTYGWRAASENFIFIGWTNTIANMPAWGARDSKLGNNPLVLAVPHQDQAIVLDMAQSQFSYGAMELAQMQQKPLSVPGGYDADGRITSDPGAILQSERALPAGYWKGAGLALLLDVLASLIAGGLSTADISRQGKEYGVSQVFIAIDCARLGDGAVMQQMVRNVLDDYLQAQPASPDTSVRYPGQGVLHQRETNQRLGIPVDPRRWAEILALAETPT